MAANIRQAIIQILSRNPDLSKYQLANELELSTSTHINNYLSGTTKKPNANVVRLIKEKYDIEIEGL